MNGSGDGFLAESHRPPKKRILVVDDDPMAAAAVRQTLVRKGFDVVGLPGGAEALEWLESETPDLIVLDVVMPGLSGFDVCRRLRERDGTRYTPVIFLTALNRLGDLVEGKAAGSDLYLVKPVLTVKLINMVEMFLSPDVPLSRRRSVASSAG